MILADVQRRLAVPKTHWNAFGEYYYRNADDILSAAKKVIPEDWAIIATCKPIQIGDWIYQSCTVTLTNGTESYSAEGWAREVSEKKKLDGSQLSGAAMSFAKKYALCNLLAIDDEQDSDALGGDDSEAKPKPNQLDDEKLTNAIVFYCAATGIDKKQFAKSEIWKAFVDSHPKATRTQQEQDAFADALIEEVSRS